MVLEFSTVSDKACNHTNSTSLSTISNKVQDEICFWYKYGYEKVVSKIFLFVIIYKKTILKNLPEF